MAGAILEMQYFKTSLSAALPLALMTGLVAGLGACSYEPNEINLVLGYSAPCPNPMAGDIQASSLENLISPTDVVTMYSPFVRAMSGGASHTVRVSVEEGVWRQAGELSKRGTANGTSAEARFYQPRGLAITKDGRKLYIADSGNNAIREWDLKSDQVRTIAGQTITGEAANIPGYVDDEGVKAMFNEPSGLALSDDDDTLYVVDRANNCIRKISELKTNAFVTTHAGICKSTFSPDDVRYLNGKKENALFRDPRNLARLPRGALGEQDDWLVVTDAANHTIRVVTQESVATLLGGPEEPGQQAEGPKYIVNGVPMAAPTGIAVHPDGWLVYADHDSKEVRLVCNGKFRTLVNATTSKTTGGKSIEWKAPAGVSIEDRGGNDYAIYVTDSEAGAKADDKVLYIITPKTAATGGS